MFLSLLWCCRVSIQRFLILRSEFLRRLLISSQTHLISFRFVFCREQHSASLCSLIFDGSLFERIGLLISIENSVACKVNFASQQEGDLMHSFFSNRMTNIKNNALLRVIFYSGISREILTTISISCIRNVASQRKSRVTVVKASPENKSWKRVLKASRVTIFCLLSPSYHFHILHLEVCFCLHSSWRLCLSWWLFGDEVMHSHTSRAWKSVHSVVTSKSNNFEEELISLVMLFDSIFPFFESLCGLEGVSKIANVTLSLHY